MHGTLQSAMQYVDGAPNTSLPQLQANFKRLGVDETQTVREVLEDASRSLRDRQDEIDRINAQLRSWQEENNELQAQLAEQERNCQEQLDDLQARIGEYGTAAVEYRKELDDTIANITQQFDSAQQNFDRLESELQSEIDQLSEERVVLINRIDLLESKVRQNQLTGQNPALLVDGRVIDSADGDDRVFIDRGRAHHIVLGMTFEVYDDEAALQQVDRLTGQLPRGKASLQVIKVGQTTSTCKIVRSVPGRPVVRDDVVANAVYDPRYQFKFLVHGKFDVDGDGRPTEAEAEYLRSLVLEWGGQIVTGDELPGDLDFLVLGEEPPLPLSPRLDAPQHDIDLYLRRRKAYDTYNQLKKQATDAQIPVLNSNRFFILTGYIAR
jgi:hypothetical protein